METVKENPKMTIAEWQVFLKGLEAKYGPDAKLTAESDDPFCGTELIVYVVK